MGCSCLEEGMLSCAELSMQLFYLQSGITGGFCQKQNKTKPANKNCWNNQGMKQLQSYFCECPLLALPKQSFVFFKKIYI
jgi:hypothetical protein